MSKKLILTLMLLVLSSLIFGGYLVIKGKNPSNFDYKVKEGEEFVINIDENITTSYSWQFKIKDEEIVKLNKDEYLEPKTNLVGGSGTHKFIFAGKKKGETTIIFKYYRIWEGEESSVETKEFKVKVY